MLRYTLVAILAALFATTALADEENHAVKQMHVHIQNGVLYSDVQNFSQESYVLKVLAEGSPMTVFWQFEVFQSSDFWFDQSAVVVRLGRQVIPDLVTKRWLMRDLNSGVVRYTSDIHAGMVFLTEMSDVAIVDASVLLPEAKYRLNIKLFMHEGESEEDGWWSTLVNWGEDMGYVNLLIPSEQKDAE